MAFESTSETVAPIGTELAGSATEQVAEPSIIDIADDNALIRVKGAKDPVRFADYTKGFQAQATRASQERARIEKELNEQKAINARFEAERQAARQPTGPTADPYADLKQLPYLTGENAAEVVQSLHGALQQRDQIILATLKKIQQLEGTVGGLNSTHSNNAFESKIAKVLEDGGWGPELSDLAKETYLAYEWGGDDSEFPGILAQRVEQIQKYFAAKRDQAVSAARRSPFVPGKGGMATPGKPLTVPANANSRQVADLMWDSFQGLET